MQCEWRIERDYQELKEEVGLDHYEGRTWAGLHHHLALCTVAHSFLMLQRAKWQAAEPSSEASTPQVCSTPGAAGSSARKKSRANLESATA